MSENAVKPDEIQVDRSRMQISDTEVAVEIIDMHKWFGDFHVLRDINLKVMRGERIVVCGPSGSGKSTLIRCINRLEEHQKGKIVVDGIELTNDLKKIDEVRREVGMVFQHFNLFPHLTILENCTLAPIWVRKMPKREAEERAHRRLNIEVNQRVVGVLRQRVHRLVKPVLQVRLRAPTASRQGCGVLQRPFPLAVAINLPEAVEGHGNRDGVQPRGERRVAPELVESVEGPQERLLREIPGQLLLARHPIGQTEDPVHILIVEDPVGSFVARPGPLDHCSICQRRAR